MDIDGEVEEASNSLQVEFVTKLKLPPRFGPFSVSSNITRLGLSDIVNDYLKRGRSDWENEPFDFIIDGKYVLVPLGKFLIDNEISAENTLEIRYIKALPGIRRKRKERCLHGKLVTAVDGSNTKFIVTGCHDNLGRIWKSTGMSSHVLKGHRQPVTSVCVVGSKVEESTFGQVVATASMDRTVRLWKFDPDETIKDIKEISAFKVLRGHNSTVQSVASQSTGEMVCSGSWDCRINLWKTNLADRQDESASIQKRKRDGDDEQLQSGEEAVATLVGHRQCVSCVVWRHPNTIASASWDHSIRQWDVETGKDSLNIFCGPIGSLDVQGDSTALIAAGCDPILRIWDPRRKGTLSPIFEFSSHYSWISSCKWHDKSSLYLFSASYDGKIMLWDLRTTRPVKTINTDELEVFCADWWRGDSVIVGGANSTVEFSPAILVR